MGLQLSLELGVLPDISELDDEVAVGILPEVDERLAVAVVDVVLGGRLAVRVDEELEVAVENTVVVADLLRPDETHDFRVAGDLFVAAHLGVVVRAGRAAPKERGERAADHVLPAHLGFSPAAQRA